MFIHSFICKILGVSNFNILKHSEFITLLSFVQNLIVSLYPFLQTNTHRLLQGQWRHCHTAARHCYGAAPLPTG